jgi:hypothetical protein
LKLWENKSSGSENISNACSWACAAPAKPVLEAFPTRGAWRTPYEEARRLAEQLEIHYTPKHGGWLNIAEIELSVLGSQCLNRRIPDMDTMRRAVSAWESDKNNRGSKTNWQLSTADARIKLKRRDPTL